MTPIEVHEAMLKRAGCHPWESVNAWLHGLVDSASDPTGIRCDTSWCVAFDDHRRACGMRHRDYAGLVHGNRAVRAEARDRGEPYESGVLFAADLREDPNDASR